MAVVQNITPDVLALFSADAPPCDAKGKVTVKDERFVNRAWPKSTWKLVEQPKLAGHVDASTDDAWIWAPAPETKKEATLVAAESSEDER